MGFNCILVASWDRVELTETSGDSPFISPTLNRNAPYNPLYQLSIPRNKRQEGKVSSSNVVWVKGLWTSMPSQCQLWLSL